MFFAWRLTKAKTFLACFLPASCLASRPLLWKDCPLTLSLFAQCGWIEGRTSLTCLVCHFPSHLTMTRRKHLWRRTNLTNLKTVGCDLHLEQAYSASWSLKILICLMQRSWLATKWLGMGAIASHLHPASHPPALLMLLPAHIRYPSQSQYLLLMH